MIHRNSRGSVVLQCRARSLGVWLFRWKDVNGKYRGIQIGFVSQFRTKADAWIEVERSGLRRKIFGDPLPLAKRLPQEVQEAARGGYVYLVSCGEFTKIGRAVNVKARLASIQNASPHECGLLFSAHTGAPDLLEGMLHRQFKHLRHRGEWFRLSLEDVEAAINRMRLETGQSACQISVT